MHAFGLALIGVVLLAGAARAETPDEVAARGEQLAKEGRLTEAIEAFKRADRLEPRARYSCLIALAYIRRELWPQAEIFLSECHRRANARDPLPDWMPLAERQLAERLASARVAAVHIRVVPRAAVAARKATITVSSFAPDERFEPRTIHLPIGVHLVTVAVDGKPASRRTIDVRDGAPRELTFDLEAPGGGGGGGGRVVPWGLVAAGGAVLASGAAYHLFAFKPARDRLLDATDDTPDPALYDRYSSQFDTRRAVTIALYGVGAAAVITGVVLRYTRYRDREPPLHVSAERVGGGGIVGVGWRL